MNQLLSLQLWHLLKNVQLTEVVTQTDWTFVNVLNSVCLGTVDENIENTYCFLKAIKHIKQDL